MTAQVGLLASLSKSPRSGPGWHSGGNNPPLGTLRVVPLEASALVVDRFARLKSQTHGPAARRLSPQSRYADHGARRVGAARGCCCWPNRTSAVDHERHAAVTSLARIFAESPNADAAHIDRGILAWLAEVDPEGDPAFHGRVVRAVADAAIRYDKKLGLIPAQDGAQAALAWIAEHPEKLRSWSGADGLMVKTLRNKISTAVSTEHGDHKVTVDGLSSRPRIYFEDETPLSELAAADALAADDDKPKSFEDAVHSRLGPRAHVPSAEDAYFAKLDGVTSETRIGASAPVPYEIKLGREYVDGHDPGSAVGGGQAGAATHEPGALPGAAGRAGRAVAEGLQAPQRSPGPQVRLRHSCGSQDARCQGRQHGGRPGQTPPAPAQEGPRFLRNKVPGVVRFGADRPGTPNGGVRRRARRTRNERA
jgi:hypothetical protein